MALESVTYISDLVATNPAVGDDVAQGDDHLRNLKTGLLNTFANITGAVTATHTELNYVDGVTSNIQTQLDAKAPLASPTLTGTPAAPTASAGTNTTQIATTAFVTAATTAGKSGDLILLNDTTISGTPSAVDFVNGTGGVVLSSTYDEYLFTLSAVKPSTDGVSLLARTSTDAGSTYAASSGDYRWDYIYSTAGTGPAVQTGGGTPTSVQLIANIGTASGEEGVSGHVRIWKPSAASPLLIQWELVCRDAAAGGISIATGGAFRNASADVDAIRFLLSSGTFASGRIKLFGRKL